MKKRRQVNEPFLEVTFRQGRPVAAYLYLAAPERRGVHSTRRAGEGLVVDLDKEGVPVGIEITAPEHVRLAALNDLLREYALPELTPADLHPVLAA